MPEILMVSLPYSQPPLSTAYALTSLEQAEIEYDLLDLRDISEFESQLNGRQYKVVCIGGLICDAGRINGILEKAKACIKDCKTILGGRIASAPSYLLSQLPFDYVVFGEAYPTFPNLVKRLLDGYGLEGISNIGYKEGNVFKKTRRKHYKNLEFFHPTWDRIDLQKYINILQGRYPVTTGIGCVGRCSFCNPGVKGYRIRPAHEVISEIMCAKERYKFSSVLFMSEIFYYKIDDLVDFCKLYTQSGIGIPWSASMRVDCDLSLLKIMADAGCRNISIGMESFDDDALKGMKKGVTTSTISKFVDETMRNKIIPSVLCMAGNLNDTAISISKTVDYVIETRADHSALNLLVTYPGTDVYTIALERGFVRDEMEYWLDLSPTVISSGPFKDGYPNVSMMTDEEFRGAVAHATLRLVADNLEKSYPLSYLCEDGDACYNCGHVLIGDEVSKFSMQSGGFYSYSIVCPNCLKSYAINKLYYYVKKYVIDALMQLVEAHSKVLLCFDQYWCREVLHCLEDKKVQSIKDCFSFLRLPAYVKTRGLWELEILLQDRLEDLVEAQSKQYDTIAFGGFFCHDKFSDYLKNRFPDAQSIVNLTPKPWKKYLEGFILNSTIQKQSQKDTQLLGKEFGEYLKKIEKGVSSFLIAPAGKFAQDFSRGLAESGHKIEMYYDTYMSKNQSKIEDIPLVGIEGIFQCSFDKVAVVTQSIDAQNSIQNIIKKHRQGAVQMYSLNMIYSLLWDRMLT